MGAPGAWVLQHVTGFTLTQAQCSTAYHGELAFQGLTLAVMAVAAAVAVLAELSAIAVYRRTRDLGDEPPASRMHFLSIVGMTIGPLFLAIILMSGLGAAFLDSCTQS
jgi:Mn2+/Fe2+ NRAMP family transporter